MVRSDGIKMGLNHPQSLICTYSADDLRPLMEKNRTEDHTDLQILQLVKNLT